MADRDFHRLIGAYVLVLLMAFAVFSRAHVPASAAPPPLLPQSAMLSVTTYPPEATTDMATSAPAESRQLAVPEVHPARLSMPAKPPLPPPLPLLVKPTPPSTPELGPDVYIAHTGESVAAIARLYIGRSAIMTVGEFERALRQTNHLQGNFLKKGQLVLIPEFEREKIVERPISAAKDYEVRAIYLTGLMAGSDHGIQIIRRWREVGGNAVVFDIKDSDGSLSILSSDLPAKTGGALDEVDSAEFSAFNPVFHHPLAPVHHHAYIHNLPKLIRFLHANGMRAIARMALFRDESLVKRHPELAVHSRRTGAPWRENGKLVWTDPSHPEVQQYDLALAEYVAGSGADEIQFDYVRFPAEGDQADAAFHFQTARPDGKRSEVISDFLAQAYEKLHARGVLLSLDVFGVMAWQRPIDLAHTGQDIPAMALHCDVLSPMIYPSHFFGMDGYAKPGDAPEHFISESMEKFAKITAGSGAVLRPWLQAFAWRTKSYSPEYIRKQVEVARAHGGIGFLFWNARNDYSKPFAAMPEMRAAGNRYFRGDELTNVAQKRAAALP